MGERGDDAQPPTGQATHRRSDIQTGVAGAHDRGGPQEDPRRPVLRRTLRRWEDVGIDTAEEARVRG